MGIIKAPAGGKSVPLGEITATAEQILTGFFGMSNEGIIIPGIIPNNGLNGNTQELNTLLGVSGTYTDQYYVKGFPKGYYGAPEISDDQNVIYFDKALTGNAIASDIVSGKTATSASGLKMSGTLSLSGNAATSQVLSGKTFYTTNPKSRLTGTMPSQGAITYTPKTYNQTLAAGRYLSGAVTVLGDADMIAANIRNGKNIFGVSGIYGNYKASSYAFVPSGNTLPFTRIDGVQKSYQVFANNAVFNTMWAILVVRLNDYRKISLVMRDLLFMITESGGYNSVYLNNSPNLIFNQNNNVQVPIPPGTGNCQVYMIGMD